MGRKCLPGGVGRGGCLCWPFLIPKPPFLFSLSRLRKKRCFHCPDPLTAPPCPGGRLQLVLSPRGDPGQPPRCSLPEDGGISCSFPGLTKKKKVFLLLKSQKGTRQSQGRQVLTSQFMCEVGHWAKPIPSLVCRVMGLPSPPLAQQHQNFSLLREANTFSKENNFFFIC